MSDDATTAATPSPPAVPRRRHARRFLLALVLWTCAIAGLAIALAIAGYLVLGTQRALDYVVERTVADADGRLAIEGARGSLLSTIHASRIVWRGDELTVEARDTVVSWSPWSLLSRRVVVRALGARTLSFDFSAAEAASATGLPSSLALPFEVEVRALGVQRLEWRMGAQAGHVTGIAFGYAGGAREHAIRDLRFITEWGALAGQLRLAANAPYTLAGALRFDGAGTYDGGQATLDVSGTLDNVALAAQGTWHDAKVTVKAGVTPFAPVLVTAADIGASEVDIARFVAGLPTTALSLTASVRPKDGGFVGTLTASNAAVGPVDAGRVPVTALAATLAFDGTRLTATAIDAEIGERGHGGRITGRATLDVPRGPARLDLALADVDASRLASTLLATRLSGTLDAAIEETRQIVRADLRQGDLAAGFTATLANRRLTVERVHARAGDGTLTGSASLGLDAPRAFTLDAKVAAFDPARFVAMPPARLDGSVRAHGTLASPYAVHGEVALAKGSRFADLALAGTALADVTPASVRNAKVDIALGSSRLVLSGSAGGVKDSLAFDFTVGKLGELRSLAMRYAPEVTLPTEVGGSLRARGTVSGEPQAPGITLDAQATGLVWGGDLRAGTADIHGSLAPGRDAKGPVALDARALTLAVSAGKVVTPIVDLAALTARVEGSLARHRMTLTAQGHNVDLTASARGGLGAGDEARRWSGTLDGFANAGTYAVRLLAPAGLAVARGSVEVGNAAIAIAEGRVDVAKLAFNDGRIDTQGSYTGVPVAAVAHLSGRPLPFHSTLVVGGQWALTASPRLNGVFTLARERGDWYAATETALDTSEVALGISTFDVDARFADDALAATARFRSTRAGTGDATFTLGPGSAPGRIDAATPFTAKLAADLASLRPLQPWLGTSAVLDGRLRLDLAASGTLGEPVATGTLAGDALRFDLPQYGVQWRDGTLRAHLAQRTIVVDELAFAGGTGRFTATGSIAAPGKDASEPTTRLGWQAQDFTLVNRPDLQLVADGKGTLSFIAGKVRLAGDISLQKGRIEYAPTRVGRLSDDVVIVGAPPRSNDRESLPLALDLQVALGRDFRFTGEGLDTRLTGGVHVTTSASGTLAANGTIEAVAGTYYLFGQRLTIDRGRLIFNGPLANPGLDVVALRRNLAVEAGVEVSGTVQQPRVRLVSNPPVSDGEKLSWILTGQGLDRASRNDIALLGAASASLLPGSDSRPLGTRLANTIGLDDISVESRASATPGAASTQVATFGKRISDRLTLVYEQGLSLASNALRIEYALTRSITLRAEAGFVNSVGVFYRRVFD